jgi:hypothetical protein
VNKPTVGISYLQSLLWVALIIAVMLGASINVELVFFDFIHGNPHRTQSDAFAIMETFPPLFAVIAAIGTLLVFGPSQVFQARLVGILERKLVGRARFAVLLALPVTAVLTWYCYDYLTWTITDGYKHGISLVRYLRSMGYQAPVTLFGLLYFDAGSKGRARWPIVIAALAIATIVGVIWGYETAQQQIQLLGMPLQR